jgi:hypothetical protein
MNNNIPRDCIKEIPENYRTKNEPLFYVTEWQSPYYKTEVKTEIPDESSKEWRKNKKMLECQNLFLNIVVGR